MKKNSTKRRTDAKVDHLKALAFHLSAVLNNPKCPAILYNAVTDITTEMSNRVDHDGPEMIEKSIRAYAAFEARRTSV